MYGILHPGNTVLHPHSNPSMMQYRKQTLPAWQAFVISCISLSSSKMPAFFSVNVCSSPRCGCLCLCVCVRLQLGLAGHRLQPLSCSALIDILPQQHLETGFHCRLDLEPPPRWMMTAPRAVQWAQNSQWHHPSVQQGFDGDQADSIRMSFREAKQVCSV